MLEALIKLLVLHFERLYRCIIDIYNYLPWEEKFPNFLLSYGGRGKEGGVEGV